MATTSRSQRVFLLGLDGATLSLLRPWAEEGHLPTLARLMADGTWGPLMSTTPASTPVAWTSMVTGVYPGKHGIFGFVKRRPGSYDLDVVTSLDRRRPAIWNLLDRVGLRSIVVDVPFTYPPEQINGIMISGLGTPDVTSEFVHPKPLREVVLREFAPYPLDIYYRGDVMAFLEEARRLTDHRLALARFLAREFPWDFFMLGLMATDRIQHVVWKYLDPGHFLYTEEDARRYRPAILGYYRRLDEVMAELVALAGPQATFVIASDHGFGPMDRSLSLLRWLAQQGMIALGGRIWEYAPPDRIPSFMPHGPGQVVQQIGGGPYADGLTFLVDEPDSYAGAVFRIANLHPDRRYEVRATIVDGTPDALLEFDDLSRTGNPILGGGYLRERPSDVSAVFQPQRSEIELFVGLTTYNRNPCGYLTLGGLALAEREDWSKTVAYVLDTGDATEGRRIRLNVRGREPNGIVERGEEYERVRDRIASGVLALRDDRGRPLVSSVYRREDLYRGPYVEEGPDLVVGFAPGVGGVGSVPELYGYLPNGPISVPSVTGNSGNHRREGIFVACGEGISRGQTITAEIVDLAPTILCLLGAPVLPDMDGRVLQEILVPGTPAIVSAAASPRLEAGIAPRADEPAAAYTPEDRQKVEDRLRRLGYIE
ncbi:MAG: alkaline phosphatase family protein [Armatimonadota bacterium]|nr:alkaline phosphatase family protein [Armatimonadota bacterium]MDR7519586.1 alkaline phosphatase family protein [Armatimonadota bacterium]MDR7549077.1 alkaline phosphatase family protein [Armatimonadota bacterium]